MTLLGPLVVTTDAGPVVLGGFKQRAVLALLALRPDRYVGVEELIDSVWPEDPPGRPRKTLQVYVANLRRELGGDRIVSGSASYRLKVGPDETDVARFERLLRRARRPAGLQQVIADYEAALSVWPGPGPALADLVENAALAQLVRPLADQRAAAVDELATARLEAGSGGEAIAPLRQQLDREPWRESSWGLLMQALYQTGRQADALTTYRQVRSGLDRDLGIEPGPELRELHARILRHDLARPAQPATSPLAVGSAADDELRMMTFLNARRPSRSDSDESDPESFAQFGRDFAEFGRATISEFGGLVLDAADGMVLAAFGYPQADEDDPHQAVRAALALVAGSGGHAAVHSGQTLVQPRSPLTGGPAGRRAAEVRRLAVDGQVLVTPETAGLVVGRFILASPGDSALPGGNGSGPRALQVSGEAIPEVALVALTGRTSERRAVADVLAAGHRSTIVLIHGEAGIGKSALLASVMTEERPKRTSTVVLHGDRHHRTRGLHPFSVALRHRYADRQQCAQDLALLGVPPEHAATLSDALSEIAEWPTALSARSATPTVSTGTTAASVRSAVLEWLTALGSAQSLWLAVEDLQFVDDETLSVLEALPDEANRLVIIMTSRAEQVPAGLATSVVRVSLGRLSSDQARALVVRSALPRRLRLTTVNAILAAADGHPLHLRVLARDAEHGADITGHRTLPLSLEGSIRAVLDGLGPLKRTAQRCSVLGTTFDARLAELVSAQGGRSAPGGTTRELEALVHAGILRLESRMPGESERYRFSHDLVEQVAYHSLPRGVRAQLHGRVADDLITTDDPDPATLARHQEEAGRRADSARLWIGAGSESLRAGHYSEAVTHLRRGLHQLDAADPGDDQRRLELQAQLGLATALLQVAACDPELERALDRARQLADDLGHREQSIRSRLIQMNVLHLTGRFADSEQVGSELADLTLGIGYPHLRHSVRIMRLGTLIWTGRLREAYALFDADDLPSEPEPGATAIDRQAVGSIMSVAGLLAFLAGRRQESDHWYDTARRLDLAWPASVGLIETSKATTCQLAGDVTGTHQYALAAVRRAVSTGSEWYYMWGQTLLGWVHAVTEDPREGRRMIDEALSSHDAFRQFWTFFLRLRAQVESAAGQLTAAMAYLDEACAQSQETGELVFLPYVHLEKASLLGRMGDPIGAAAQRQIAYELAHQQGNGDVGGQARPELRNGRRPGSGEIRLSPAEVGRAGPVIR